MSTKRRKVMVLNGVNLNLLGVREPEIYGRTTLAEIEESCVRSGADKGLEVTCHQSNDEGQLIAWIHAAIGETDAIVINAGAFTHTSIAIHDALRAFPGYKIEFHITNPHRREAFRHTSCLSGAVDAVVSGLGVAGYEHVVAILARQLDAR